MEPLTSRLDKDALSQLEIHLKEYGILQGRDIRKISDDHLIFSITSCRTWADFVRGLPSENFGLFCDLVHRRFNPLKPDNSIVSQAYEMVHWLLFDSLWPVDAQMPSRVRYFIEATGRPPSIMSLGLSDKPLELYKRFLLTEDRNVILRHEDIAVVESLFDWTLQVVCEDELDQEPESLRQVLAAYATARNTKNALDLKNNPTCTHVCLLSLCMQRLNTCNYMPDHVARSSSLLSGILYLDLPEQRYSCPNSFYIAKEVCDSLQPIIQQWTRQKEERQTIQSKNQDALHQFTGAIRETELKIIASTCKIQQLHLARNGYLAILKEQHTIKAIHGIFRQAIEDALNAERTSLEDQEKKKKDLQADFGRKLQELQKAAMFESKDSEDINDAILKLTTGLLSFADEIVKLYPKKCIKWVHTHVHHMWPLESDEVKRARLYIKLISSLGLATDEDAQNDLTSWLSLRGMIALLKTPWLKSYKDATLWARAIARRAKDNLYPNQTPLFSLNEPEFLTNSKTIICLSLDFE